MAKNTNLGQAKKAKKDEFYTQLTDIEKELRHYKDHFRGKTVLCNCDDPKVSNFFVYFVRNFNELGLKRLITTCYKNTQPDLFSQHDEEHAVWLDYQGGDDNNPDVAAIAATARPLKGDGDFRSAECIELLKEADIVVTNPPFSLFREYVAQLVKYDKKFLIIARMTSLHYADIFPLIKQNKIWVGYGFNLSMIYKAPYENNLESNKKYVLSKGYDPTDNYIKVPAILWYTNLDHQKRHDKIDLYKKYNLEDYPKYDNFDAIDVGQLSDIPIDYDGIMGVPDTLLGQYNPEQFEIIGLGSGNLAKEIGVTKNYRGRTDLAITKDGVSKCPYSRILIRRKQE